MNSEYESLREAVDYWHEKSLRRHAALKRLQDAVRRHEQVMTDATLVPFARDAANHKLWAAAQEDKDTL